MLRIHYELSRMLWRSYMAFLAELFLRSHTVPRPFFEMSRKNIKLSGVCAQKYALQRKKRVDTPDRFGILRDNLHFEPVLKHQNAPQRRCTPDTFGISRDILKMRVDTKHSESCTAGRLQKS